MVEPVTMRSLAAKKIIVLDIQKKKLLKSQ